MLGLFVVLVRTPPPPNGDHRHPRRVGVRGCRPGVGFPTRATPQPQARAGAPRQEKRRALPTPAIVREAVVQRMADGCRPARRGTKGAVQWEGDGGGEEVWAGEGQGGGRRGSVGMMFYQFWFLFLSLFHRGISNLHEEVEKPPRGSRETSSRKSRNLLEEVR